MRASLLMIAICLASFLGCLDLTIVNTALPSIQQNLKTNIDTLQWIMTGLFAALAGCMVIAGKLADIVGHRRLIIIGLIIFSVASLLAAISPSIQILIFARIVQGVGIAILYTAPPAFINHVYEKEHVSKMMGYYFSASSLGIASGPLLGGFIVSLLGWRWIFYLNVPLVLIALSIIILCSEANEIKSKKILDIKGGILLTISLIALLISSNYVMINLTFGLILFVIACLVFLKFYFYEKQITNPILDFKLFRYPTFLVGGLSNIALASYYTTAFFIMPLYLSFVKHCDAFQIGLILLPATLMLPLFSPWVNRIVQKFSVWYVLMAGFLCFSLSAFIQMTFNVNTPLLWIMIVYSLIGIGWAFILSPSFSSALISIPKDQSGEAMGTLGTLHNAGGSIGLAVAVMLFGRNLENLNAVTFVAKQPWPFLWIGTISFISFLCILVYTRKNKINHI